MLIARIAVILAASNASPIPIPSTVPNYDFHDGPVVQWDPSKSVYTRYAMSYTQCSINNNNSYLHSLISKFIETFAGWDRLQLRPDFDERAELGVRE